MPNSLPDSLLLIAPGCAHCPRVLEGLTQLLKAGRLARLEVVNVAAQPEISQQTGARSVPWCRIGRFELEGVQSPEELSAWTAHAAAGTGLGEYYRLLLATQRPHKVASMIDENPSSLEQLLALLEDSETPMTVRIGIGVVLEDLKDNPVLMHALPTLRRLADSEAANVRADVAHYLGLTQAPEARAVLRRLLRDEHADVREIAAESLTQFNSKD